MIILPVRCTPLHWFQCLFWKILLQLYGRYGCQNCCLWTDSSNMTFQHLRHQAILLLINYSSDMGLKLTLFIINATNNRRQWQDVCKIIRRLQLQQTNTSNLIIIYRTPQLLSSQSVHTKLIQYVSCIDIE